MSLADARAADEFFRQIPAGLSPFATLPRPEPRRRVRARMADIICRLVSSTGAVTREQLEAAGFDGQQIRDHFRGALRASGVAAMVT